MPVSGKGLSSRRRLPGLAPLCRAVGRRAFSCGAGGGGGGGGWSARRRRHPRLCPGQPGQRATVLRRRRRSPRRGWGRRSPSSLASGGGGRDDGHDLLPLLPSARGCRPPRRPSCSRRCTGRDRSRAASPPPPALPSRLPDGAPSPPPPRRPPEPAAVSAGGSGERGFRRPGIGRRDDRLLAAEARCEARVGFLCLREWVCGGWGGGVYVCLFWFCPSPYRFFAARVRGRVKQSRGRRLRPLGRLSGECRRQLHFSLAASEGRVVSLLGFCRRFCETVACLSKIKPFIFPQTTLIVFCDRISVSFPSLSLPLSLWLMQWSEESCS